MKAVKSGHDRWSAYCFLCQGHCYTNPRKGRRRADDERWRFLNLAIDHTRASLLALQRVRLAGVAAPVHDHWLVGHYKREAHRLLSHLRAMR